MDMVKVLSIILLVSATGCVQMRDYTGVREGAFGLDIKKGIGEGELKKDYYVVKDGVGLFMGDSKGEVINIIGLPNDVDTTFEGYERWIYEERKVKLIFKDDKLYGWQNL